MEAPGGAVGQAVCAMHPDSQATATCGRCGNYTCQECNQWGQQAFCPSCRDRVGIGTFIFTRDNWSLGGLLSHGWDVFVRHWGMLVLVTLLFFAVSGGLSFMFNLIGAAFQGSPEAAVGFALFSQVVQTVINIALALGTIGVFLGVLLRGSADLNDFFRAMKQLGRALVQYLLVLLAFYLPIGLIIFLPPFLMDFSEEGLLVSLGLGVVLLLPVIYVALGLAFMQYELVHDESCGPIEALRRSWALADGQRLGIFLVGLVGGLIFLAGMLLCCVGMLVSYPVFMLMMAGLYLALRNGAGLPNPAPRV